MSHQPHPEARQSNIGPRNSAVIVRSSRSSTGPIMSGSSHSARSSVTPGTYQAMSSSGVSDIQGNRQKEKKDLQGLNERFATYISKVRYLEANCAKLEEENEELRKRIASFSDIDPIKQALENELAQARKTIDELTASKGEIEAKCAGCQEELADLRETNKILDRQLRDIRNKFEPLNSQIGELQGELGTLHLRIDQLEDDNANYRESLNKTQDQCKRLRADLDTETAAHIEADGLLQTKTEEAQFYKDLYDELKRLRAEPLKSRSVDNSAFWNTEMKKAVKAIQDDCNRQVMIIQEDMTNSFNKQMSTLKNGSMAQNNAIDAVKTDVQRLKSQLADKNAAYNELAAKFSALQAERDELARENGELERELDTLRLKYETEVTELQDELTAVLAQLQTLMDAKMSLELEIACYKKLLEGEETRVGLRSLVEDALGSQKKGAIQTALENELATGADQKSTLKESTGSLTVQRSSKGPIAFKSMDHSGGNIVIENTSSGARKKNQNLKNWRLTKTAAGRVAVDVTLEDFELESGKTFMLWAKGAKDKATEDNEQICDKFSFGVGTCTWKLLDDAGQEKATLNARFTS